MMMKILLVIEVLLLFCSSAFADDAALSTDQQKSSYAIGLQMVLNLRRQEITIERNAFLQGIEDALSDRAPRLSKEEITVGYAWQQNELNKRRQAKAERSLVASKAFLDENRKGEGVRALASGLQYKVLEEGKGPRPKPTDTVTVRYRGTSIDGTEFYNSARQGKSSKLTVTELIKGLQEALQFMPEGAKWRIFIPPNLAHGEQGSPDGKIGPNETLVYEVALLSIGKTTAEQRSEHRPTAIQSWEEKRGKATSAQ